MHPSDSHIDAANEKLVYWLSFALRCVLGLLAWWASWYTDFSLVEDAVTYETMGRRIVLEWMANGTSPTLQSMMVSGRNAWGMIFVLASFSFVLRGARALPLIIVLFNLITAWTLVFIYRTSRHLGLSDVGAPYAARLVIFSPVFAFWGEPFTRKGWFSSR